MSRDSLRLQRRANGREEIEFARLMSSFYFGGVKSTMKEKMRAVKEALIEFDDFLCN